MTSIMITQQLQLLYIAHSKTKQNDESIKLLLRIFDNILQNANDKKYQDLKLHSIQQKLKKCPECMSLLLLSGFYKSTNNRRLFYDMKQLHKLKQINQSLINLINNTLPQINQPSNGNKIHTSFDEAVKQLISMGFAQQDAYIAASMFNNDVNLAAQAILYDDQQNNLEQHNIDSVDCKHDITSCQYAQILAQVTIKYLKTGIFSDEYNLVQVLNAFNHLLFNHNENDIHFEYLCKLFGGECQLSLCKTVQRKYENENQNDSYFLTGIFDRIHCQFQHGYDMFRFRPNEIQHIEDTKHNDIGINIISNRKKRLNNLLTTKQNRFKQLTNSNKFANTGNKFSTNLCQIKLSNNKIMNKDDEKDGFITYSYSFDFNYWEHCKCSEVVTASGKMKDFYIPPKYNSLKHELLNNKIATISMSCWNNKQHLALNHLQTSHCQEIVANVDKYMMKYKFLDDHPSRFGYNEHDEILIGHLIVIMIYCDLDQLQTKFSQTYRGTDFDEIKQRHRNFHYFAKFLKEAIEVFGNEYWSGDIRKMYHGINKEMLFAGMDAKIHCALSTTASQSVAIQFSNNTGMVLELIPHGNLKYFDCCWLSKFPAEQELLFIGGFLPFTIVNIINTAYGWDFYAYISVLRILDAMVNGYYFNYDQTIVHKIRKQQTLNIKQLGISNEIKSNIKKLTNRLIEHELHRYEPKKYAIIPELPRYIEKLLHSICVKKYQLSISLNAMDLDFWEEYNEKVHAHIGFKFLKKYFCANGYEGINFNLIHKLFPSLKTIFVYDFLSITSGLLHDVLTFIQQHPKSIIYHYEFVLHKETNHLQFYDMFKLFQSFEKLFQLENFRIGCGQKTVDSCWRVTIGRESHLNPSSSNILAMFM